MTSVLRPFLVASLVLVVFAASAQAGTISRHERVAVKAKTIKGKKGFRLSVTIRPESLTSAELGLGRTTVREKAGDATRVRQLVTKKSSEFVQMMFPKVALKAGTPHKLDLDVTYGEGNSLKPGDKVDVFTLWNGAGGSDGMHVFGVFTGTGLTSVTLP